HRDRGRTQRPAGLERSRRRSLGPPRRRGNRDVLRARVRAKPEGNTEVMSTATRVEQIPAIDRHEAATIAATEYQRFVDMLRTLGPDDWARPTDCAAWDVRAMAGH